MMTQTFQLAPPIAQEYRPKNGHLPVEPPCSSVPQNLADPLHIPCNRSKFAKPLTNINGTWYKGLKFANGTGFNRWYYGDLRRDSLSISTKLKPDMYKSQHTYRVEYETGPGGYIRWSMDGKPLAEIPADSVGRYGKTPGRLVSTGLFDAIRISDQLYL